MRTLRIVHPFRPAKLVPPQNESYLQYRGAHYLFLPDPPPKEARCVVCRGPWAGDACCERCHAPMDFDCHQNRVIAPAERLAFQEMLDELNAPGPMVEVEIGSPEGHHFTVTVRADHRPADDLWLIVLCPGCRS
jgi:hypothetical protein